MFKKDVTASQRTKLKSSIQRNIRAQILETYPLLGPHIDSILPKKSQLDTIKIPDARCTLFVLPASSSSSSSSGFNAGKSQPLFWQHMDDTLVPHLALVHRYPDLWPRVRIDRGGIRFVLGGAALMVPGLTSKGGRLPSGDVSAPEDESSEEESSEEDEEGEGEGEGERQKKGGFKSLVTPATGSPLDEGPERYAGQPDLPVGTVVVVEAEGKENACCVGPIKMGTREMREAKKGVAIEAAHYLGDGLWRLKLD